jgi:ADP-ribose pyrophosphatase YjhB (NUDIX family)
VTRIACVGAIVRDERGRLLMIKRGTSPGKGQWSIPGGRIEVGESPAEAAAREVEEETGLQVSVSSLAGVVELVGPDGVVYDVEDYHARVRPDTDPAQIRAGDDAADVGWFYMEQLLAMDCVQGLLDTLRGWQVVPHQR